MKKATFATIFFLIFAISAFSQPVKPHTFSPLDPVSSSKINANFDTIYQWGSVASAAIELHKSATEAHGATGAVVGLTNSQTLTNKTIGTGSTWNGNAISDAYLNTAYSNAAMSGHRNSITSADTRNTNYEPDDRDRGLYADFKGNSTDGLSDGSSYHGVLTFRPYGLASDMSGGYPFQLGFTENTNVWLRKGTSATAWSGWYKLFHSGHTIPDGNIDSALARDSEVTSAISTHAGLTATHGATGAVMGTTNTQTAYSKTLYSSSDTSSPYWHKNNDGSGSGLDADLLDGSDSTYFDHRRYTDPTNYLGGFYVSGGTEKPNNAVFGAGKLKLAMLAGSNLGFGGSWNDVLWMSSYGGADVKGSFAIVGDKYSDNLYFARQNWDATSWGTGNKLWHNNNDGPGSGLEADSLPPKAQNTYSHSDLASAYINGLSSQFVSTAAGWENYGTVLTAKGYTSGGGGTLQFYTPYGSGYGGTSLKFRMADYSVGAAWTSWRTFWDNENDGSGSGLDADLLDGYHISSTYNAANTVPVRDASGYLWLGWINTVSGSAGTTAPTRIYGSYDGFLRYYTPDNFKSVMGLTTATAGTANTVALRDSSGDITTRLFRTTYAEQTTAPATTADIAFRNDTSDNYIRFMDAAALKAWMINSKIGVVQTSAPASPVDGDIWVE